MNHAVSENLLRLMAFAGEENNIAGFGGFKSEALGISLCAAVESNDPTALIGLPLIKLLALLRSAGYEIP